MTSNMAGRNRQREQEASDGRDMAKMTKTDDQAFRFLDLLPELRNRVYKIVFSPRDANGKTRLRTSSKKESCLHLLQTCHQVLSEAECIYYAENELVIDYDDIGMALPNLDPTSKPQFLISTDLPRLRAIASLTIECKYWDWTMGEVLGELELLEGLKELHLCLFRSRDAAEIVTDGEVRTAFRTVAASAPAFCTITIVGRSGKQTDVMKDAQKRLQGVIDNVRAKQAKKAIE